MAYKNTSVHANSGAKDMGGDLKSVIVEVIGGGTIDGATKKVVGTGDRCVQHLFADDRRRDGLHGPALTSEPASGEFSRWFIDDICDEVGVAR